MLGRLFQRRKSLNRSVTEALYGQIVAAARQPEFYSNWNVPDTPLGRFEMLSVHMFLFLHRAGASPELAELAQDATDMFFMDVDHSLRELGVGDIGVPKRMKRLARMFYGRAESYGKAIEARDGEALAVALSRNIFPGETEWPPAAQMSAYVMGARDALDGQAYAELLRGELAFPRPAAR